MNRNYADGMEMKVRLDKVELMLTRPDSELRTWIEAQRDELKIAVDEQFKLARMVELQLQAEALHNRRTRTQLHD